MMERTTRMSRCGQATLVLCREWLKDVPRRGVAFATNAVHGQFYTGCVGNEMTS